MHLFLSSAFLAVALMVAPPAAASGEGLLVPVNRSELVTLASDMAEVIVANPEIADVHAHGTKSLSVIAKKIGRTSIRVLDREGKVLRTVEVTVGYDLPSIRRALKNFLPAENISVEMVNKNVALTGEVSNAQAADRAVKIVNDFIGADTGAASTPAAAGGAGTTAQAESGVLNLLQVTASQQVMLRVRVGEIKRDALKRLGIDPGASIGMGNFVYQLGVGTALESLDPTSAADYVIPDGQSHGINTLSFTRGNDRAFGVLKALERDGLFKTLAEPNLVAISGEKAEFLAGGEIPIPTVQGGTGTSNVAIEYKPFGVAVQFTPYVLSENRIRMMVQPEVSEVSTANAIVVSGFNVPSINTRRAKTTVELAPGESFMIAGLIKDQTSSSIDQLPGVKELPVLGALFRSTEFQRNETELVMAVTPYIVNPSRGGDVKLPTDNFAPASQMDMFFFGSLGALSGQGKPAAGSPAATLEGPVGFMVD